MKNTKIVLERPQKKLQLNGMILFIIIMDMFIPLSTDMYLPALPTMSQHLSTTSAVVNLSITGFFFSYAIGMLIWGPLSDKYGRKRPLFAGFFLYTMASLLCMISWNIGILVFCRVCKVLAPPALQLFQWPLSRIVFRKNKRNCFGTCPNLSGFGPILAPVIGSWLLFITNWRGIFFVLLLFGVLGLLVTALYEETLLPEEQLQGSVFQSFGHIRIVMSNPSFVWIVLIYSVILVPFFAYLTMSSYI